MSIIRYTLTNGPESKIFGTEKVMNWSELEPNLIRSKSYRGRVRKITNTFNFVDDIRRLVINNGDKYGVNANHELLIEVGNDNGDEFSFEEIGNGYPMVADYSKLKRTELTADLNFLDSDFQSKISTGEKEKINITTPTTLDGSVQVTDYTTLLKTILMPDRSLAINSKVKFIDADPTYISDNFFEYIDERYIYVPIPVDVVFATDDNYKNIPLIAIDSDINSASLKYYLNSEKDRILEQSMDVKIRFSRVASTGCSYRILKRHINVNDELVTPEEVISFGDIPDWYGDEANVHDGWFAEINYNVSENIDITTGDSLQFLIEFKIREIGDIITPIPGLIAVVFFDDIVVSPDGLSKFDVVSSSNDLADATTSKCILPHEFFTHYIEIMTGRKNAFYSEYFGRTDILDSKGNQIYYQDGEGAYISIHDGNMIRNLPIEENPMNTTFKDMVEDFIKLKNLVAGIEHIGNVEVFRIEKYKETFNTQTVVDLGDLVSDVEMEINSDLTFSSINAGYKDIKLEDLNGLLMYNGQVNYTTPLKNVDNTLDLVLKSIAGDYAIEQQRRLQYKDFPTTDGKFDKDMFLVEATPTNGVADLVAKQAEDYESVTGILEPLKAYNLGITPHKIVLEWGIVIRGCLQNHTAKELVLTKSASNNTLVTKKVGENAIDEGANIKISDLTPPLMLNQKITIGDTPQKINEWNNLEANSNGIVKFVNKGTEFFGYADIASFKVADLKSSFTLTQANR